MGMYRGACGSLKSGIQKGLPGGGDVSAVQLGVCKDPEESECLGYSGGQDPVCQGKGFGWKGTGGWWWIRLLSKRSVVAAWTHCRKGGKNELEKKMGLSASLF